MLPYAIGPTYSATVAITRPSNTTAYVANDVIGAADTTTAANAGSAIITIPEVGAAGSTVLIQTVELFIGNTAVPAGMGAFRLHFYKLPPAAILDNAAFDLASTEAGRYIGFASLEAPTDLGSTLFTVANDVNLLADLAPYSSRLYAELETIGGYTPASGTVYTINITTIQVTQFRTGQENLLWSLAGGVTPSLDLEFARTKTLNNEVTGTLPVTFTRASTATYVGSDGLINTAAVNEPRFDHNPTTGESLGLLVEEQRVNRLLHNRTLTNAAWVATNITAAKDQAGADGVSNSASRITATAGNGTILQTITSASAARATSAYVKRITGTGTIQMTQDNGSTWTAVTVTSNWTRVTISSATVTNPVVGFRIATSGDAIAVDYVQCEDGAFSTSAIETTTATVTRSADVASISGSNFSSWYRQDEGTLYAEFSPKSVGGVFGFDNTTSAERMRIGHTGSSAANFVVTDNNVTQASLVTPANTFALNSAGRIAGAYKTNDFNLYANGNAAQTSDDAGTLPIATQATLGNAQTSTTNNGTIRRLTYWPARLPNATLQTITQ